MNKKSYSTGTLYHADCMDAMHTMIGNTIDLIACDPPYGYEFMGRDWDKAVVGIDIWKECLRVLKPGGFAFIMSAPRQDVLSKMICNIAAAGFDTEFSSIYWAYSSGFIKAMNMSKAIDRYFFDEFVKQTRYNPPRWLLNRIYKNKPEDHWTQTWIKLMEEKYSHIRGLRKITGTDTTFGRHDSGVYQFNNIKAEKAYEYSLKDEPDTEEAKKFDGSYAGYNPKPAVEIIIVAMKPLYEKNYIQEALTTGHGVTWLEDCKIPTNDDVNYGKVDKSNIGFAASPGNEKRPIYDGSGRVHANLLVSDNALGKEFSKYFDLDIWFEEQLKKMSPGIRKAFPFLPVPKPSKTEKNAGCESLPKQKRWNKSGQGTGITDRQDVEAHNIHPTVKPMKLFTYLITLGSRQNEVVLDPFLGSGTTALAAQSIGRKWIGIEREENFFEFCKARMNYLYENVTPDLF